MDCFDKNYLNGVKYFINYISLYKDLIYLPIDLRRLIWEFVVKKQYMTCTSCGAILLKLLINNCNNNLILRTRHYITVPGKNIDEKCNRCEKYK